MTNRPCRVRELDEGVTASPCKVPSGLEAVLPVNIKPTPTAPDPTAPNDPLRYRHTQHEVPKGLSPMGRDSWMALWSQIITRALQTCSLP